MQKPSSRNRLVNSMTSTATPQFLGSGMSFMIVWLRYYQSHTLAFCQIYSISWLINHIPTFDILALILWALFFAVLWRITFIRHEFNTRYPNGKGWCKKLWNEKFQVHKRDQASNWKSMPFNCFMRWHNCSLGKRWCEIGTPSLHSLTLNETTS